MSEPSQPPTEVDPLAKPKLVLEYLRVLAWPALVIGLLLIYRPPLGDIIRSLASKIQNAEKLGLGSFSVEVAEKAREAGNPELAQAIGQLSPPAIQALMRTPRNGSMILLSTNHQATGQEYGLPANLDLAALRELEQKKFIVFEEPLTPFLDAVRRLAVAHADSGTTDLEPRTWYRMTPGVADTLRLERQGYRLTDRGRQATEAITRAVGAQLSGVTDSVKR